MAKLTKQVKDFMWSKIRARINEVIDPMTEQVKTEEQHISEVLTTAKEKANELFQSILKAEFPDQWKELEKNCTTDSYSCLPYIATNYTHLIYSPARRERDKKKSAMEERAKEQFNELVMEVELGGVKKDDVLAMIAKMDLGE